MRAPLLLSSKPKPGLLEQLRADLHPATRKPRVSGTPGPAAQGKVFLRVLWPAFAALELLRSSRAKRSSQAPDTCLVV